MMTKGRYAVLKVMVIVAALVSLTCLAASVEAQIVKTVYYSGYNLVDLGANMGNTWSFGYGINNSGQAVGEVGLRGFRTMANQPFMPGTSDDLGVLSNDFRSYAFGINNNGAAVGESVAVGGLPTRAILSSSPGAALQNLNNSTGYFISGADRTFARSIDDYGWIVGYYKLANSSVSHSMLSFGSGYTYSLDYSLGYPIESEAYAAKQGSQIVGWRYAYRPNIGGYRQFAYFLRIAGNTITVADIVLPGGIWSKGYGLNDNRMVVGESGTSSGYQHAFSWQDANSNGVAEASEIRDLDTMNSSMSGARGVNNGGTAVGYYGSPDVTYGNSRATIFANGQMTDLNTQVPAGTGGWILRMATGINDAGQIVGWMEDSNLDQRNRVRHAFRLDPRPIRIYTYPF
jgi:probable HAF family extracellular repeat protein